MKRVALTFDDGPNGQYTLDVLKILAKQGIKACFFMPAMNVEREPEIAKKAHDQGHLIGSHAYDHPHLTSLTSEEVLDQINLSEEVFQNTLGIKPKYFRPPYGEHNDEIDKLFKDKGYTIVLWDMDCYSRDYQDPPVEDIVRTTTEKAKNGSILLLHDGRNIRLGTSRATAVEALPKIITILKDKGFEFVRLDELI